MNEIATQYKILSLCFHDPQGPIFSALQEAEPFRESLHDTSEEELRSEYARIFSLTVAGGIPPYETEYGHKDVFFKTQSLADIAGFYRAFGFEISGGERVDFIGAELELMYWMTMKEEMALQTGHAEEAEICRDALAKFMRDHLGRWGAYFGDQLARVARHPFYVQVGRWLSGFILEECLRLKVEVEQVTGWIPDSESVTEFECGLDKEMQAPQPLTVWDKSSE